MANYNKSFNFRNGVQVDNDNFIVNSAGLVGIGTTIPTDYLDVYGTSTFRDDITITGLVTSSNLYVSGISTILGNVGIGTTNIDIAADSNNNTILNAGIVTANFYYGSGLYLSDVVGFTTEGWNVVTPEDGSVRTGLSTTFKVGIGTTQTIEKFDLVIGADPDTPSNEGIGFAGNAGNIRATGIVTAGIGFTGSLVGNVTGNVTGDVTYSSGISSFTTLIVGSGITLTSIASTFVNAVDIDGSLDVDGHTELDDVNVSGASTFIGDIDADGNLSVLGNSTLTGSIDVDGHSELDDVNVSGASTFVGVSTFNSEVSIGGSIFVAGISTFKGAIDADGDVDIDGHTELDNVNVAGVSTFNDDIVIKNGSDVKVNWDKSEGEFTFSQNVKAVFDDGDGDTSPGLEISHSGTDSLIQDYGEGNFILKTSSSTFKILGNSTESMIVANPNEDVQLYNDGTLKFNTVSTGASVYGQINVARLNGGTNTLSTKSGSLKYGNETSAYDYSTRKSFDVLNNDTGNINFYVDYANVSTADTGSFYWHKGTSSRLMALTYDGKLGIGQTLPEMELHVSGGSTVSGNSYYGGDLTVYGTLTAVGNITGNANFGYIQGNIDASSLIQQVGVSTFHEINVTQTNSILAGVGIGTTNPNDYRLDINEDDKRFFVDIDGNIGIKTDVIDDTITINALQGKATFGAVGVGTTNPQSSVDFREAGQDATGDAANRMYMYPPKVTTPQRNALTGMTGGAFVYNTTENRLEFYQQGVGWRGVSHTA